MKHVENSLLQGELLPIIKPLIMQILEEEILSKGSSSLLTNGYTNNNGIVNGHTSVPITYEANAQTIKAKELELIERVIRLEEQSNYIREDIKKVHIDMKELRQDMKELRQDMKELRQDMDKRFIEIRQDMDKRFSEVRQDMDNRFSEVRQDMDKRFSEVRQDIKEMSERFRQQNNMIVTIFSIGITFLTTLITVFKFIK